MLLLLTCLVPAAGGVILPFLPFRDDSGRKAARIILMAVTDILGAACIAGGSDAVVLRHPRSAATISKLIAALM